MVRNKKPVHVFVGKREEKRPLGLASWAYVGGKRQNLKEIVLESGLELFGSELGLVCL